MSVLCQSRLKVITAVDGNQAIKRAIHEQPHCIVLDVILPKRNGFEVCRELKTREESKHIPIILLTAINNTQLGQTWDLRTGADVYMTKPVDMNQLVANVRHFV